MTDKVIPLREIPPAMKEEVIDELAGNTDVSEALKIVAILKVMLLADVGCDGGLNKDNRARAWRLVAELGKMLMAQDREKGDD